MTACPRAKNLTMAEKLHESLKILLQIVLPFLVVLASTLLTKQVPLQTVTKILVISEIGLFIIAFGMNLFHYIRISLLMCDPPLCLRASCQLLRRLLLLLAGICGMYVFLSIEWMRLYPQQQLELVMDFLYTVAELGLALFAIGFTYFANSFAKRQRKEKQHATRAQSHADCHAGESGV